MKAVRTDAKEPGAVGTAPVMGDFKPLLTKSGAKKRVKPVYKNEYRPMPIVPLPGGMATGGVGGAREGVGQDGERTEENVVLAKQQIADRRALVEASLTEDVTWIKSQVLFLHTLALSCCETDALSLAHTHIHMHTYYTLDHPITLLVRPPNHSLSHSRLVSQSGRGKPLYAHGTLDTRCILRHIFYRPHVHSTPCTKVGDEKKE